MKRLLILTLVLCIIIPMAACGALPTDIDIPYFTPSDAAAYIENDLSSTAVNNALLDGAVTYCTSQELTGDFGRGMWTRSQGDMLVQSLIDDASIIYIDRNGEHQINNTVCNSIDVKKKDKTVIYTVSIAQDLVYNDGSPIDARDYVLPLLFFSSSAARQLEAEDVGKQIVGHDEYSNGQTYQLKGIRLIDKYTYSVTITISDKPYYDMLSINSYPMNIAAWLGTGCEVMDQGEGAFIQGDMSTILDAVSAARVYASNRVSCGPYTLVSYDNTSKIAIFELNQYYKGNCEGVKPSIKKIAVFNSENDHVELLLKGDVDIIEPIKDPEVVSLITIAAEDGKLAYNYFERNGFSKLLFQCDNGATMFKEVRKAFAYVINRRQIISEYLKGAGEVINGPFSTAMWQYKASDAVHELEEYEYSLETCIDLLEEGGWILDLNGESYSPEDGVRYKAISNDNRLSFSDAVTLTDGTVIAPLMLRIALPEGNNSAIVLRRIIENDENVKRAGFAVEFEEMPFQEEIMYLYRNAEEDVKYAQAKFNAFALGMDFKLKYDLSDSFIMDADMQALGYNPSRCCDKKLESTSISMLKCSDTEDYIEEWESFVKAYNDLLPELPLYMNSYLNAYSSKLSGYSQTAFWGFDKAIVYAATAN